MRGDASNVTERPHNTGLLRSLVLDTFSLDPKRSAIIDSLRGIAILLVVVQHALFEVAGDSFALRTVIRTFNIPLFAFASGMLLVRVADSPRFSDLLKRVRSLLVPYFAWLMVAAALVSRGVPGRALQIFLAGAVDARAPSTKWFLYALFWAMAIFIVVRMTTRADWVLLLTGVAFAFLPPQWLPIHLGDGQVLLLYLAAGYLIQRHRGALVGWIDRLLWPITAITLLFLVGILIWQSRSATPGTALAASYPLYACAALPGVITAYGIANRFHPFMHPLAWMGMRSMGLYVCHGAFLGLLAGSGWVGVASSATSALAGGLALTLILERIPTASDVLLGHSARPLPSRSA